MTRTTAAPRTDALASRGPTEPLITFDAVSKVYHSGTTPFTALHEVSLAITQGECVAVVGKSGSGKTTLINVLTGIDSPTSGTLHVGARAIHGMSQEELAVWRGRQVGIVFQFFQLLPTLTVLENVLLPMDFCDVHARSERRARAMHLLERLGISDQAGKLPADLSGGQQQRAAIARALANDPSLLVADEPTGNLDSVTSRDVMQLLATLAAEGKTVVTVTHESELREYFSRTIMLRDGVVQSDASAQARCGAQASTRSAR